MKHLIILFCLFLSFAASAQTGKKVDSSLLDQTIFFTPSLHENDWSCDISSNGDTLNIQSPKIKYLKIDGMVYEVVRSTELRQVHSYLSEILNGTILTYPTYPLPGGTVKGN